MDDLILEVDEPAGDMGTNGVFDFMGDQEPAPPPVVQKDDAANFVDGAVPDSLRPGEQPTKQDLKESYQVDKPAPTAGGPFLLAHWRRRLGRCVYTFGGLKWTFLKCWTRVWA